MNIVPSLCELCQYGQKNGRICYMPGCKNGNKFKQRGVEDLEKELDSVKQERDAALAQVAVLRGALKSLVKATEAEDVRNKHLNNAHQALATTPSEAAERVQRLVTALEEIQKSGTGWDDDGSVVRTYEAMLAASALSDWRRNHDS